MSNGSILVVSATIQNGNTYVQLPTWNPLSFNVVTAGVGASVQGGALVFAARGPSTIAISIQMVVATGGPINVHFGYAWDGATVTELMNAPVNGSVPFNTTIPIAPLGTSLRLFVSTDNVAVAVNWTQGSIIVTQPLTSVYFPTFTPIYPPPTAGNPVGVPVFPPPTPPPIGTVPIGPLVGPVVPAAPAPPSTPGFVQPRYQPPGSATVPPASGYWPQFTTTTAYAGFPNQPPAGVPLVFANIWTIPTFAGGVWTPHPPPSTVTVGQIILDGWGLPGPSGTGPGPPGYPNPPGAGLPHVLSDSVSSGYAEPAERPLGPVLQFADAGQLHQPVPPTHSRRKRMSARGAAGGHDLP